MITIATVATRTAPLTAAPTSAEAPAVSGTSTATPTVAASIYSQLIVRPTVAANDATGIEVEPLVDDEAGVDAKPVTASTSRVSVRGGDANARLRSVVGKRLVRARLLSGLFQHEVAERLGYSNQTQLNLWELSHRLIPLTELIRVAEVLGVTEGYLLGSTDEPERDPSMALRHACLRGVRVQLARVAEITVDQVARHARLIGPHIGTVGSLVASGDALLDAIQTFCRLNHEALEEQRGSATVVRCAEAFETELLSARKSIRLHDSLDGDLRRALAAIGSADPLPGDSENVD